MFYYFFLACCLVFLPESSVSFSSSSLSRHTLVHIILYLLMTFLASIISLNVFLLLLFSKPFSFFPFQILPHVVCHNFLQTFQVLFSFFYCFSHFFKLIFTFHPFFFFLFFFVCFFYYPFQVLHLLLLAVCSLNSIDSTTLYFANAITNSECFYWRQLT